MYIFFFENGKDLKEGDMVKVLEYNQKKSLKNDRLHIVTITKYDKVISDVEISKENDTFKATVTCGKNTYTLTQKNI